MWQVPHWGSKKYEHETLGCRFQRGRSGNTSVLWALGGLSADEFLDELFDRKLLYWNPTCSCLDFAGNQLFLFFTAGKKSIVPDFRKAMGQNMHQESPDKLIGIPQRKLNIVTIVIGVVAIILGIVL